MDDDLGSPSPADLPAGRDTRFRDHVFRAVRHAKRDGSLDDALRVLEGFRTTATGDQIQDLEIERANLLWEQDRAEEAVAILDALEGGGTGLPQALRLRTLMAVQNGELDDARRFIRGAAETSSALAERAAYVDWDMQIQTYLTCSQASGLRRPLPGAPNLDCFILMMIRDENDIILQNLVHHYTLGFRRFIILNNLSVDGTTELIRVFRIRYADATVIEVPDDVLGYYQAGKTSALLAFGREYFAAVKSPCTWCFILDGDEFLDGEPSSTLLADLLEAAADKKFIAFHLSNTTSADRLEFDPDAWSIYEHFNASQSRGAKITLKAAFRTDLDVRIRMGNHRVVYPNMGIDDGLAASDLGIRFAHLAMRSCKQLIRKLANGMQAANAIGFPAVAWAAKQGKIERDPESAPLAELTSYRTKILKSRREVDEDRHVPFRFW